MGLHIFALLPGKILNNWKPQKKKTKKNPPIANESWEFDTTFAKNSMIQTLLSSSSVLSHEWQENLCAITVPSCQGDPQGQETARHRVNLYQFVLAEALAQNACFLVLSPVLFLLGVRSQEGFFSWSYVYSPSPHQKKCMKFWQVQIEFLVKWLITACIKSIIYTTIHTGAANYCINSSSET